MVFSRGLAAPLAGRTGWARSGCLRDRTFSKRAAESTQRHINGVVSKNEKQPFWFWRDKAALLIRPGLIRPGLCSPKVRATGSGFCGNLREQPGESGFPRMPTNVCPRILYFPPLQPSPRPPVLISEKGEVLLRGVGTLRHYSILSEHSACQVPICAVATRWFDTPRQQVVPRSRIPRSTSLLSYHQKARKALKQRHGRKNERNKPNAHKKTTTTKHM